MPEYIDREAVITMLETECSPRVMAYLVDQLNAIPAADVRPVVRATWKRIDYKPCGHDYECSSCGWKNDMETHFCPNCGAMMKEDKDG